MVCYTVRLIIKFAGGAAGAGDLAAALAMAVSGISIIRFAASATRSKEWSGGSTDKLHVGCLASAAEIMDVTSLHLKSPQQKTRGKESVIAAR